MKSFAPGSENGVFAGDAVVSFDVDQETVLTLNKDALITISGTIRSVDWMGGCAVRLGNNVVVK
jgi:hypothetical protein